MLPAAFQLRVLRRTVCLSLSVTNASALSFRSGAGGASLEGILFMCSYLAILIVTSADLTGLFVTDASLDKASAMPKTKFRKEEGLQGDLGRVTSRAYGSASRRPAGNRLPAPSSPGSRARFSDVQPFPRCLPRTRPANRCSPSASRLSANEPAGLRRRVRSRR